MRKHRMLQDVCLHELSVVETILVVQVVVELVLSVQEDEPSSAFLDLLLQVLLLHPIPVVVKLIFLSSHWVFMREVNHNRVSILL
jgi:hypothetical protein